MIYDTLGLIYFVWKQNGNINSVNDAFNDYNGKISIEGIFNNGLMDGNWVYYNEDGELWKEEKYNNGELINKLFYTIHLIFKIVLNSTI